MSEKYPHVLSKSRFVSGVQCAKKLFLETKRKDLKPAISASQQAVFDQGNLIGKMAQDLFPNGIDLTSKTHFDYTDAIENTLAELQKKSGIFYEAAFYYNEVLSVLDILLQDANGVIHAIEVKSSSAVKDYYLSDAALQYWVMANAGYAPKKFSILTVNNAYVKNGPINLNQFFTLTDITDIVIQKQAWVSQHIDQLKLSFGSNQEPAIAIGKQCGSPFECDFKNYCWGNLTGKDKVFNLYFAGDKSWNLYKKGIEDLADIPADFPLTHRQICQVNGAKTGADYIDSKSIKQFLGTAVYPLYFFDFETVNPVVPVLDGTSPFQQVGFQYSLHIVPQQNAAAQHKEFLANAVDFTNSMALNPRLAMIAQMKADFGATGSIVTYNASFEKSVLKKLSEDFPAERAFLENLISRIIDLHEVFRNAWYYTPAFGKSASIKDVLPALVPNLSYKELQINNGELASGVYLQMITNTFAGDTNETRKALLAYCKLDTLAMLEIWKVLEAIH